MHDEVKTHGRTHFAGPWLSLLDQHMLRSPPEKLHMELFRDELCDDDKHTLGFSGRWLRKRTFASSTSHFSLKYSVTSSSSCGTLKYKQTDDIREMKSILKAQNLNIDFPCVVAWYDCLRVYLPSGLDPTDTEWVEITKLGDSLYYFIATALQAAPGTLSNWAVAQLRPRSKTLEALHHQNPKCYSRLESKGWLGEHVYHGSELSHLTACPKEFAGFFAELQKAFVAKGSENEETDENDSYEEFYYLQLMKMKKSQHNNSKP